LNDQDDSIENPGTENTAWMTWPLIIIIILSVYIYNQDTKTKTLQENFDRVDYEASFYHDKLSKIYDMAFDRSYNYNELLDDIQNEAKQ
jgi:hypothetical protein